MECFWCIWRRNGCSEICRCLDDGLDSSNWWNDWKMIFIHIWGVTFKLSCSFKSFLMSQVTCVCVCVCLFISGSLMEVIGCSWLSKAKGCLICSCCQSSLFRCAEASPSIFFCRDLCWKWCSPQGHLPVRCINNFCNACAFRSMCVMRNHLCLCCELCCISDGILHAEICCQGNWDMQSCTQIFHGGVRSAKKNLHRARSDRFIIDESISCWCNDAGQLTRSLSHTNPREIFHSVSKCCD